MTDPHLGGIRRPRARGDRGKGLAKDGRVIRVDVRLERAPDP